MGYTTKRSKQYVKGNVLTFSALPSASDSRDSTYLVDNEQGSKWTLNHKKAGQYKSNGTKWIYLGVEILQATTAEMEDLTITDVKRMSPANVNTAIEAKALPSMTLGERNALTETGDRAVSPNDIRLAVSVALPSMTLAERNALSETEDRSVSPNDISVILENNKTPTATLAEITALTGTDVRLLTPANIGAAIENNALTSISLAERNALTETQDRAVSPNDLRVAIDSRLPPTATAAEITDLTSTDVKLLSPANIGVAIENNALLSMTLAERNVLTETSDRAMSPNDIRQAVSVALPSMSLAERNALSETGDRSMSPNDLSVSIDSKLPAQASSADIDGLTNTDIKSFSPKNIADAVDSFLPSMSLSERNDLTETQDRAVSPNDIRVAIIDILNKSQPKDVDLKTVPLTTGGHEITSGGVYLLSGNWSTNKPVIINTQDEVTIKGTNSAKITTVGNVLELKRGSNVLIDTVNMKSTSGKGIVCLDDVNVKVQFCHVDARDESLTGKGGNVAAEDCEFESTNTSAVTFLPSSISHNVIALRECSLITFNTANAPLNLGSGSERLRVNKCFILAPDNSDKPGIWFDDHSKVLIGAITDNDFISISDKPSIISQISDGWGLYMLSGNTRQGNKKFVLDKDSITDATTTPIVPPTKQGEQDLTAYNDGTWSTIGQSGASSDAVFASKNKGREYLVTCSVELRTPTVDGNFRWAELRLHGVRADLSEKLIVTRAQGASNSIGVGGYDYASISLTYPVAPDDEFLRFKISLASSDNGTGYRKFHFRSVLLNEHMFLL